MPEQKYKTVTKLSKDGKRFIKVKVPVNTKKTTKKNSTDNRRTIAETKLSKDGKRLVNVTRNNKSYNPDFKPGSTVYNSAGKAIKISDGKTFTGGDNVPSRPNIEKEKPTKPRKKQSTKKDFGKSLKQFDTSDIKSDKEKLSTSKATAATLKDLGLKSTAKKESKKQLSNKERRQQNRAANLALRTGKTLDEASALKEKRRTARKQYLRNFASQLARGEQAAPIKGFGEGEEGKPTTASSLVGTQKEIDAKREQVDQDTKSIQKSIDTFSTPNSDFGLGVTPMGGVGENFGIDLNFNTPDLTASKYMQQEYRKKRGL